ncbi:c-type cytochrome [Rubrolithibacter danxiaensis]|uniref:c-type cytochrome n=1 Tax=Rubrolithibacter danxiaensis TaxID=3390805 RepID=UPI003BF7E86F
MRNRLVYISLIFFSILTVFYSCQSEEQITYARYFVAGKNLYEQHCQNCHNSDGKGLGELYPPLTDTIYLKENKNQLACIIKNGFKEKIEINGKVYQEQMPAEPNLADIEIAELITYITNSFGNQQGLYETQSVQNDLKQCR